MICFISFSSANKSGKQYFSSLHIVLFISFTWLPYFHSFIILNFVSVFLRSFLSIFLVLHIYLFSGLYSSESQWHEPHRADLRRYPPRHCCFQTKVQSSWASCKEFFTEVWNAGRPRSTWNHITNDNKSVVEEVFCQQISVPVERKPSAVGDRSWPNLISLQSLINSPQVWKNGRIQEFFLQFFWKRNR